MNVLSSRCLTCPALLVMLLASCDQPTAQMPGNSGRSAANNDAGSSVPPAARRLVAETAAASLPLAEGDYSWPRLLGSGFDGTAAIGQLQFDWQRDPQVAWQLPVGNGYGLGCVHEGRYYHLDARRNPDTALAASAWLERLRAIDLRDGSELWSVERPLEYRDLYGYETGPRGTPATDGEFIVSYGVDGGLYCRRLSDGSDVWHVPTNERYGVVQNFFGVGSSPLLWQGKVIVPVGGSPPEDQQIAPGRLDRVIPNGSALVAFDLRSGEEVWRCGEDLASYSSPRTMEMDGQTVILLFARHHLMAVDPEVGEVLWKHAHRADKLESVNAMMPIVQGRRVFISECYDVGSVLLEVSRRGAETVWQDPERNRREQAMRCHWSTPVLIDGYLYGCSGRNNPDSDFRCVEFGSGDVMWDDGRRSRSSVTRVGDHLAILDEGGTLQIVRPNPEQLEVVAEHDYSDLLVRPSWAAPLVVGNRMLIRGNRSVLCLALPTRPPNAEEPS